MIESGVLVYVCVCEKEGKRKRERASAVQCGARHKKEVRKHDNGDRKRAKGRFSLLTNGTRFDPRQHFQALSPRTVFCGIMLRFAKDNMRPTTVCGELIVVFMFP